MKMIRYSASVDKAVREQAAAALAEWLLDVGDREWIAIAVGDNQVNLQYEKIDFNQMGMSLTTALSRSVESSATHGLPFAFKSVISCRFVFFHDDGFFDLCLADVDAPESIGKHFIGGQDISKFLLITDFYDFI